MRWMLPLMVVAGWFTDARAGWIDWPGTNLAVCTGAGNQVGAQVVSDGSDGFIVAWTDDLSGPNDIHAQRVLSSGRLDPRWPTGGRLVVGAGGTQEQARIVGDGAGGAVIVWMDNRDGSWAIYAHHVLGEGLMDPSWPVNGRALSSTAPGYRAAPATVSDGSGGALVAWQELRNGSWDIVVQRILASGHPDPAWPTGGRLLVGVGGNQLSPALVEDGAGGAIVVWQDYRSGTSYDIYAQRITASGEPHAAWPMDGRALCTAPREQLDQSIASDGAGGAFVAWSDYRSGSSSDIYVHHVLAEGTLDPAVPVDGRAVCAAFGGQSGPVMLPDGSGGVIVAWDDSRTGLGDIYAHHVLSSGAVDPTWPIDGSAVCISGNQQQAPLLAPDGHGGAIVAWHDSRSGDYDVYAQRLLSSGVPDPAWPIDGLALGLAPSTQYIPAIVADGAGGALVAWQDHRSGTTWDIYAQRVTAGGRLGDVSPAPSIAGVRDIPNDQGGKIKLMWNASPLDSEGYGVVGTYVIWRSVPHAQVQAADPRSSRETMRATRTTATPSPGTIYWEQVATQPARRLTRYSMVVETTSDSLAGSNPYTLFMVEARGTATWDSAPDSGYSVDNLAPLQPSPFVAVVEDDGVALHWGANREPDLLEYRIHRGPGPGFVPDAGNRIAAQPDTGFRDRSQPRDAYYKIAAVDVHGNVSPYAAAAIDLPTTTLLALSSIDVSPEVVRLAWRAPAYPDLLWALERRVGSAAWQTVGEAISDAHGEIAFEDRDVRPGEARAYRVRGSIGGVEVLSPEVAVAIPGVRFAIESLGPNPLSAGAALMIRVGLDGPGPARLEILDVAGRSVLTHDVGSEAGSQVVRLNSERLQAGIHFVRLTRGTDAASRRLAVVR